MPLISIITVCKNPGQALVDTVESVINQDFKDVQYIVIDSESNDGTQKYLQNLKKKNLIDQLIIEKDSGIYDAINKGINLSKGNYVGIIHAGDTYKNNIFLELSKYFNSKADIIYGLCELDFVSFSKIINLNKQSYKNLKEFMSIMHPSTFVNRTLYCKVGLYDKKFKVAGDFDFFHRSINKNYKFLFVNRVFTKMLYGGLSTKLSSLYLRAQENSQIILSKNNSVKKFFFILYQIILSFFYYLKINTQIFIKLLLKKMNLN
tara:strand:- start:10368 stop:11153 length:786 start_codon:yes stop_codon:yes gene_type:complete